MSASCNDIRSTNRVSLESQSKGSPFVTKRNIIFLLSLFSLPLLRYLILAPFIGWVSQSVFDSSYQEEDSFIGFILNVAALTTAIYITARYFIKKHGDNRAGYIKIAVAFWLANISLFAVGLPLFAFESYNSINTMFNSIVEIYSSSDTFVFQNIFGVILFTVVWTTLDFGVTLLLSLIVMFGKKSKKSAMEIIAYIIIALFFCFITRGAGGFVTIFLAKNIISVQISKLVNRSLN